MISIMMFLASCVTPPAVIISAYPAPQTQEDCMQLFVDVLAIQKKRSDAGDEMQRRTALFNKDEMGVRKYRKHWAEWLKAEESLRKRVTHIYDVGYEHGCFAYDVKGQ